MIKPAKRSTKANVQRHCNRYSYCADVVMSWLLNDSQNHIVTCYRFYDLSCRAVLRDEPK